MYRDVINKFKALKQEVSGLSLDPNNSYSVVEPSVRHAGMLIKGKVKLRIQL